MRRTTARICGLFLACQSLTAAELPDGAFARLGGSAFRHTDRPSALAYRPDGKHLASGGADGCVRIWDTIAGAEVTVLKVKDGHANILAYTPDGKHLAAHFSDEKVRLYDVDKDYKLTRAVAVKNLDSFTLTDDAKLLAAVTTGGQLLVVETATGLDRMEVPDGKAIAIAPDGTAVAASDGANAVAVLEIPSGKPLAKLAPANGDKSTVAGIAFSADSKRIAVAYEGALNRVRIYDVAKRELILTVDGEVPMAFCDGNRLALRQSGKLALYDLGTSKRVHLLGDKFSVLAVTPDGTKAATDNGAGFATARICLWNLKDGTEPYAESDAVVGLRGIVSTGVKGKYWIVDGNGISVWAPDQAPTLLSRQNKLIAFARSKSSFYISDGVRMRKVPMSDAGVSHTHELDLYPEGIRQLAVSADDTLIAAATAGEKPKLLIGTENLHKLKATHALPAPALSLAIHPEKKSVAVIGRDGFLRVWDPNGGDKGPELWKARVARSLRAQVAYSPDGSLLAVTSVVRVSVFDAETGAAMANFERQWEDGPYSTVAFSPDSRLLIAGTQGTLGSVVIWELATRGLVERFTGGRGSIAHLGLGDDGRTLSTIAADDTALLWDISGRRGKPAPTEKQLKAAWVQLGQTDAEIAWPALETMRAGGDAALPIVLTGILEAHLALKKLDRLVKELGSKDFSERENASKVLAGIGAPALPVLKVADEKASDAETRERAGRLIAKIVAAGEKLPDTGLVGEPLRLLRAVAVLEQIPGDGAKERLGEIKAFGGVPGAAAVKALKGRK